MTFYLGVDAGGSHTRARLTSGDGTLLGSGESGTANTRQGLDVAVEAITLAWKTAVSEANLLPEDVRQIRAGIGIAGLNRKGVLQGLREQCCHFFSLAIASDAAIACLGAHGGEDGGIGIVGTGSVGFARVGEEVVVVGGYGFPISDEGSGADLGLRAIRASLWARDGRIAHTPHDTRCFGPLLWIGWRDCRVDGPSGGDGICYVCATCHGSCQPRRCRS